VEKELKILYLEDLVSDFELAVHELRRSGIKCVVRRVETRQDFHRELLDCAHDVILFDFSLPGFDGLSALALARELCPDTPRIFVSGAIGEDRAIDSLKRGATDYILKTNLARLGPAVLRALQERQERAARRDAEQALKASEALNRAIIEAALDSVVTIDGEGRVLEFNPAAEKTFGYSRAEALGKELAELIFPPAARAAHRRGLKRFHATGEELGKRRELFAMRRDGAEFPAELTVTPIQLADRTLFTVHLRDITERKSQEEKVARLSRIYAVLSGINAAIVRIRDRVELFQEACRIAVEHGGLQMAWVGVVNLGTKKIEPVACAGFEDGFLRICHRLSIEAGIFEGEGTAGRAIRSKAPVVTNDVAFDPLIHYKKERLERGYRSGVVLPLLIGTEAVGLLSLYAPETDFFDDEEMRLLTELAGDIAFALEFIEKQERVQYLAYHDLITAMPNRRLFADRLRQTIASASAERPNVAVALLDLDRFRMVNDTLGRQAGDALLKEVAERLGITLGDQATLARVGGNRFAIALPGNWLPGDLAHFYEVHYEACFGRAFVVAGEELRVSATTGVAVFPGDGRNPDTLLANAEAALRSAKARSIPLRFYGPEMNARVAESLRLETRLRRALENDEFVLWYQPKVSVKTRRITGLEALIRWQDPVHGLVPPGRFIPLMEQTGLILDAGRVALQRAMSDAADWLSAGIELPRIALNASSVELRQADYASRVAKAFEHSPLSASQLEIEITESLIMENIDVAARLLASLREMGVRVSVDDFGTGYSSLAYIARLPIHALKIDRSFVEDMVRIPQSLAIVRSIISLAHSLKLTVIAEGVESYEQAPQLRRLDCDEMQGYLISPPLPPQEIPAFLTQQQPGFAQK